MGGLHFELIKKGYILAINWRGIGLKFIIESKFWRVLFKKITSESFSYYKVIKGLMGKDTKEFQTDG